MSDEIPLRLITAVVRADHVHAAADVTVPWWSIGKVVLASAALALVAKGSAKLDERLRNRPFTLRHLLQHRAGLRCYGNLPAYHAAVAKRDRAWPVAEMLRQVDVETLAYEPGHGWGYSNVGYLLVREMIEEAVGSPLGPALHRLVFGPLGIHGVTVARQISDLSDTAWGNAQGYDPLWVYPGLLIGPPGAAAMTLDRVLAGDLFPADLVAEMKAGHTISSTHPGRPWRSARYGLGLMMGEVGPSSEFVGHTGGGPLGSSAVYQLTGPMPIAATRATGAAFAAVDDPGLVEVQAMRLATP